MIPLSILDLTPVGAGSNSSQALANSIALARMADALGFAWVWYAEQIMLTTHAADHAGRLASFERVANAWLSRSA